MIHALKIFRNKFEDANFLLNKKRLEQSLCQFGTWNPRSWWLLRSIKTAKTDALVYVQRPVGWMGENE